MKTLWFKTRYRAEILSGRKTDTIRPIDRRRFAVGEQVAFSIGARPPFATAVITAIETVKPEALDEQRREAVKGMIGDAPQYRRICFSAGVVTPAVR